MPLHSALDGDQRLDPGVQPVRHEVERPVRWDKGDSPVSFEPVKLDALVEFDVLQVNCPSLCTAPGGLEENLVIEAELELRHASQVRPHLESTVNLAVESLSLRVNQQVHALHHVEEHLVLAVFDTRRTPPARSSRTRHRYREVPRRLRVLVRETLERQPEGLLCDVVLEDLRLGELRVAKVEHFIQQLVHDDEVVADTFLGDGLHVLLEYLNNLEQAEHEHANVAVDLGHEKEIQVVMLHPNEGVPSHLEDWLDVLIILIDYPLHEGFGHRVGYVLSVVAGDEALAFHVQHKQTRRHFSFALFMWVCSRLWSGVSQRFVVFLKYNPTTSHSQRKQHKTKDVEWRTIRFTRFRDSIKYRNC
eukprot:Hpha_TRINITY_DN8948_c0_g1::TRINITY_DN8948_c0_g1_i1::g.80833::m.80833